ncbi:MAG: hypothetical protein ABJE80_17670 [Reichenbachiella sp.]|uniref:hypothetical protein n=1 Tax=Reichenbachiella sp. TaxID=2184521 RepID=UPI003267857F
MKKITTLMLAASFLLAIACENKEEEVFENAANNIQPEKNADGGQIGGGDIDDGP